MLMRCVPWPKKGRKAIAQSNAKQPAVEHSDELQREPSYQKLVGPVRPAPSPSPPPFMRELTERQSQRSRRKSSTSYHQVNQPRQQQKPQHHDHPHQQQQISGSSLTNADSVFFPEQNGTVAGPERGGHNGTVARKSAAVSLSDASDLSRTSDLSHSGKASTRELLLGVLQYTTSQYCETRLTRVIV